ncbi:hypothetical protein C4573_04905 [Candidatus Woesearchaeota archaeon]|nr:MAG: hypothetical protein C4573_04905 [Candidatus Woesearchaeota archaeon]
MKAQSGSNAAIMVALITLAIILYILFLPPDVRTDLLGENSTDDDGNSDANLNKTLLLEHPGRIDYLKFDERSHELPSFRMYSTESGEVLKEVKSLYSRNGVFEKSFATMSFDSGENLNDFLLSFNLEAADGRLILFLNGNEIFNGEVEKGSPEPIPLPSDLIKGKNTLEFRVSSPGWAFWRINEYSFENIKVTANFKDVTTSASEQHFFVSDVEKQNLERGSLTFFPRCDSKAVGTLLIWLNHKIVYSAIADCGVKNDVLLNPDDIYQGDNILQFKTDRGSYLVDNLRVRTSMKEQLYPIYYFEVDDEFFQTIDEDDPDDDVLESKYNATIRLRFVNDRDNKQGTITFNGISFTFDTDKIQYEKNVDNYLRHGTNAIELEPRTTLDIVDLKVFIEEND